MKQSNEPPKENIGKYSGEEYGSANTIQQSIGSRYQSLQEIIYTKIQTDIIAGAYPPGTRLGIRELSRQMSVSGAPVRETLMRLVAEGLVEFKPRIGFYARTLTSKDIRDIFNIRISLENMAAAYSLPNLSDKDYLEIENAADHLEQSMNTDEWLYWNRAFHYNLYASCDSPRLLQIISNLWDAVQAYLRLYIKWVGHPIEAQKDHHMMLNAARERNISDIQALLTKHLNRTCQKIIGTMEQVNQSTSQNKER